MIEGQLSLEDALARVEEHANQAWLDAAHEVVVELARSGVEFTTDDVWARLDGVSTHEPRAMGPVIRRAVIRGLIVDTGRVRKSSRAVCHRNPKAVWRGSGDGAAP